MVWYGIEALNFTHKVEPTEELIEEEEEDIEP